VALDFRGLTAEEKYKWMEARLVRFSYLKLNKVEHGVIRRCIQKITRYFRAQVSRLDSGAQTDRTVEENRILKTPVPQEVYFIRSSIISRDR